MFAIKFLGFSEEDTGEMLGMALDSQYKQFLANVIPATTTQSLPEVVKDLLPAIVAWAIRKYAGTTGTIDAMLKGIEKKNIADVISARWLVSLKI